MHSISSTILCVPPTCAHMRSPADVQWDNLCPGHSGTAHIRSPDHIRACNGVSAGNGHRAAIIHLMQEVVPHVKDDDFIRALKGSIFPGSL